MLIASIARTWLAEPAPFAMNLPWTPREGQAVVAKFDKVFSDWQSDFPRTPTCQIMPVSEFTNMVSASVWADHIKCQSRSPFCENPYGIQIFNENHFVDIFYNRTMSREEQQRHIDASMERKDNASFLLRTIHASLIESSKFTANLLIRLFIHVFGDVHQPLHTMVYRGDCFPLGDRGGNVIHIERSAELDKVVRDSIRGSEAYTLHGLWDSGGWLYSRSYPQFTVSESNRLAKEIVARHPNVTFHNYQQVIEDSYHLAPLVYDEVIESACHSTKRTYEVTPAYLRMIRHISERRIAAAGFSLAFYLQQFASKLDEQVINDKSNQSTTGYLLEQGWKLYSVTITAAFLALLVKYKTACRASVPTLPHRLTSRCKVPKIRSCKLDRTHPSCSVDTMSCGTSENLSDRLIGQESDEQLTDLPAARVIVSTSNVMMKARK